ncbi:hypothetical protein RSAG8_13612, partial [Rhizoctonia solani AG-8 WAC10335]
MADPRFCSRTLWTQYPLETITQVGKSANARDRASFIQVLGLSRFIARSSPSSRTIFIDVWMVRPAKHLLYSPTCEATLPLVSRLSQLLDSHLVTCN